MTRSVCSVKISSFSGGKLIYFYGMKHKCNIGVVKVKYDIKEEEKSFPLDGYEIRVIPNTRENRGEIVHCTKARSELYKDFITGAPLSIH